MREGEPLTFTLLSHRDEFKDTTNVMLWDMNPNFIIDNMMKDFNAGRCVVPIIYELEAPSDLSKVFVLERSKVKVMQLETKILLIPKIVR